MLYRTTGEGRLAALAREARCARPGGSLRSPGRLATLAREARCARPREGLATLARAAPPPCPAFGGARGGCGPRTPWSWAGAPAPLRGPPGPVAPPPAGLRGVLGLGPPRLRWAAAGLARRPCLRLGLAPGGAPGPCGAAGPARAPSAP